MTNSFYQKVYAAVKTIPQGKVLAYKDVAALAGSPRAARAVGTAMKNNPDIDNIPCHRVVGAGGKMLGYAYGGEKVKIRMLKAEGIEFIGNKVNLDSSRWQN